MTLDAIRTAYEHLGGGNVEPLVALMDKNVEWRGESSRWRFWRQSQPLHGTREARGALSSAVQQRRRQGATGWQLDDLRGKGDQLAVSISWRSANGYRVTWAHVLTFSSGKIIDIRDYPRKQALRAVGR